MTETVVLLNPTAETSPVEQPRLPRKPSLEGLTVGLLDINKVRGDVFLDRLEELFAARGNTVNRYAKERFNLLARPELKQEIRENCDIVVEGLAD